MARKKHYLILDTETATLPFASTMAKNAEEKKRIAIAKPLVYDIGWCIMERDGTIVRKVNYLVQETFFVPNVFNTAYYCNKRPIYMKLLADGDIEVDTWEHIMERLAEDMESCDLAAAYNAAFDFKKAIPFTTQYIEALYSSDYNEWERRQWGQCKAIASGKKWSGVNSDFLTPIFEMGNAEFPIADLWDIACERLINIDKYRDYCLTHSLLTASAQFFKTSAETSFQYLGKQYDFEEAHTALDDATIEAFIMAKALKKGKVNPTLGAFPFRKLGTTFDYVMEKRPKYTSIVQEAIEDYYNKMSNPDSRYGKQVAAILEELQEFAESRQR